MDRAFRSRLILVHVSLVLVIALGATTAVLALRSTREQAMQSRTIDRRLAALEQLRAGTRELAQSARRYVLSGDLKEQQRVLAIVHAMKAEREKLHAREALAKGAVLEADLEEYIAALMHVMTFDDDDAVIRLARFEDELVRIRNPLAMTFDEIVSHERSRRDALRSAQTLARSAQWAVLIASLLGVVLAISAVVAVLRKLSSPGLAGGVRRPHEHATAGDLYAPPDAIAATMLRRQPCDAALLVDRAIKEVRESSTARGIRLRYEAHLAVEVHADGERILHVLDSLLQIAIAAAHPGTEIVVHVASADAGVRFAIIASGPGAEDAPPNELALHLCGRVIEAHGGRMGVQTSAISRTYWFTLPTEPSLLR